VTPRPALEKLAQPHAHRRRQVVRGVSGLGRVHAGHRLVAEDLRLDDPRLSTALPQARVDAWDLHVLARIDARVVKVGAAPVRAGAPAQHLRDLRELIEPQEIRHVAVLLGRSRRVQRGDRRGRGGGKDRRRLDELRLVVTSRALDDRRDERHVACRAEGPKLGQAKPVGEDHHDLPDALT
jgi:hypothetical protein